jgi:hypothetical protein
MVVSSHLRHDKRSVGRCRRDAHDRTGPRPPQFKAMPIATDASVAASHQRANDDDRVS